MLVIKVNHSNEKCNNFRIVRIIEEKQLINTESRKIYNSTNFSHITQYNSTKVKAFAMGTM